MVLVCGSSSAAPLLNPTSWLDNESWGWRAWVEAWGSGTAAFQLVLASLPSPAHCRQRWGQFWVPYKCILPPGSSWGGCYSTGRDLGELGGERGLVVSCGTPDNAGSGQCGGAQRQHAPACFKNNNKIKCLLLSIQLWLQGEGRCKGPSSASRRYESRTTRASGWGRWRCSAPHHKTRGPPAPCGSRYSVYVPRGNSKALKECVYGL